MGLVADWSGGFGDVVGSECFQHASAAVAEGRHGPWCGPGVDDGGVLGEGDIPECFSVGSDHAQSPDAEGDDA